MLNSVTALIQYESGELETHDVIELFAELIKSGMAWSLQGHYGRTATALINNGYLDREGNILNYPE